MLDILGGEWLLDRLLGASGRGALQKPRFQPRFQPRGKLLHASERGEVLRLSQCKFRRHLRGSAADVPGDALVAKCFAWQASPSRREKHGILCQVDFVRQSLL